MSNRDEPPRDQTKEFLTTFGKALLTVILGLAALVALGMTVCGLLLSLGGPRGAGVVVLFSGVVLIALIYAIYWLWH
jgi:hypothetical protein